MSRQSELNLYIGQMRRRLRVGAALSGVAIVAATALSTTVALVVLLNAYAFPERSLPGARGVLVLVLVVAAGLGVILPLVRLSVRRSVDRTEAANPAFAERLLTFHERQRAGTDPFLDLLAGDTLRVAREAPPASLVSGVRLLLFAGVGLGCLATLAWTITRAPGFLGYGASLLWTGPKHNVAPLYAIHVLPGDVAVRRNSDLRITAEVVGLEGQSVQLFARFGSEGGAWEPVTMKPQTAGSGFEFLFAGLPEDVEYYVGAGRVESPHYKVRVVDLPSVKQIGVTYHYPRWTGMAAVTEEHGGDLRAIEGTDAELRIVTDQPLKGGLLTLDGGRQLQLTGGEKNVYRGSIVMGKDGAYHVSAMDGGQAVRMSEDYFIATSKANPPEVAIVRPGADYHASPIEEVTIGIKATDDFALNSMALHYSVNGGPDKTVNMLKGVGGKAANGSATISLEDFKLVPGDIVSLYATARDGHAEAKTDISFIQAEPFEQEFSQSQQSGGGGGKGGAGGAQGTQTDISKREKELIEATWKQGNNKAATAREIADAGTFLSDVQTKLRDQVLALAGRMESRDLSTANEEFNSFAKDMKAAAAAMGPSSEQLRDHKWAEAIPSEQKALQSLLRAEATFRQIQVAFGQQKNGGGGGGGGSAGRDLASLFDLELDTQKNQYESAQTSSGGDPQAEQAKQVDDALAKLDALAKRQEEIAQQEGKGQANFAERWQQEMLRREAEQLQKQMEQMAASAQGGQIGQRGQSGQQSQAGQQGKGGTQAGRGGGASAGAGDPRVEQALNRLKEANDAMRRGAAQQGSAASARRAAEQLREATGLLSGTQKQQASGKLDQLGQEAQRLSREEQTQAERIRSLAGQSGAEGGATQAEAAARGAERGRLVDDRQRLSDDLSQLEKGLRETARQLAPTQPGASSKLRDALNGMDQADLGNRVQRTADWLRRGINPNSGNTEADIGKGLQSLSEQVRQARGGLGAGKPGGVGAGGGGRQTAALDHVERLRNQLQSLRPQAGQEGRGSQKGAGQNGAGQGGTGQSGGQGGSGGSQTGTRQRGGARGTQQGDVGGEVARGGGGVGQGAAWGNVNTGNNRFDPAGRRAGGEAVSPSVSDQAYRDSLGELNQLRELARNDPAALREVQDLIRKMERLDPSRFPGNPAMVDQLQSQILSSVDRLELQLRRTDREEAGQVRTSKPAVVPPAYKDAVAEYFRRLSGKS